MHSPALIYGDQVLDDLEFCKKYEDVIDRYSHGIMTLQGSQTKTLKDVGLDPMSVPGWTHSLAEHPGDCKILKEFFVRLIKHYERTGRRDIFNITFRKSNNPATSVLRRGRG